MLIDDSCRSVSLQFYSSICPFYCTAPSCSSRRERRHREQREWHVPVVVYGMPSCRVDDGKMTAADSVVRVVELQLASAFEENKHLD